ncbi:hypothetical protein BD779DRAFT_1507003 [Infundibulicybe gibba]|nr:hypothetical protein BD779DRAFT_1507003 [Infundibulicybe gibba]
MTSITDQERQIKDAIWKARDDPDKTGVLRRDTLQRLIDLIHSPHTPLKIVAAANIRYFFNDFPELEELAINAVYDLCEDQSSTVRIEGYTAITHVSRSENKWIKRNADVLLQLLQSDEREEVEVVKNALKEHLDMDPKVTLGVLCDQIVPIDEPMDAEEQNIRDRLRFLVLSFLRGEAQSALVARHALPGSDGEEHSPMAIPKLNFSDVNTIIKDILLPLPTYQAHSKRGSLLISTLLRNASDSLRNDLQPSRLDNPTSLDATQPYLELAIFLATNQIVPAIDLLQFYCANFTGKMTLQRVNSDGQILLICQLTEVLAICDRNVRTQDKFQLQTLHRKIANACPILLQCLGKPGFSNPRAVDACRKLLRTCVVVGDHVFLISPTFISVRRRKGNLRGLYLQICLLPWRTSKSHREVNNTKMFKTLSGFAVGFSFNRLYPTPSLVFEQSLVPPSSPRPTAAPAEASYMTGFSIKGSSNLPMKPNSNGINAPRPVPGRQLSHSEITLSPLASGSRGQDGSFGNPRKRRGSADVVTNTAPSLLSRLGSSFSAGSQWNNQGQNPSVSSLRNETRSSRSEYSIKGAAERPSSADSPGPRAHVITSSSLLDRLEGGLALAEDDIEANDRKRRRRNP